MTGSGTAPVFAVRTVIVMVAAGAVLALATLLLTGFGAEIDRAVGLQPRADARNGIGFHALMELTEATGPYEKVIVGTPDDLYTSDLVVATPRADTQAADVAALIARRTYYDDDAKQNVEGPTLIVLPKWTVTGIPLLRDRVTRTGLVETKRLAAMLPPMFGPVAVMQRPSEPIRTRWDGARHAFLPPDRAMQTVTGSMLEPVVEARSGGALIAKVKGRDLFIAADPDLFNNFGLGRRENARAALEMLALMHPDDPGGVAFDVTLLYAAGERNVLKLMFTPPFLAVTLALIGGAVLAGMATANRFGPPRREQRAFAAGKLPLIDTITMLTRLAGRTTASGAAYADAMRDIVLRRARPGRMLTDAEVEAHLDSLSPDDERPYSDLRGTIGAAQTEPELLDAAQALHDWRRNVTR
jgi:hypothetical protein